MIDYISASTNIQNFESFKDRTKLEFSELINTTTGARTPYKQTEHLKVFRTKSNLRNLEFVLIEKVPMSGTTQRDLYLKGSIHKFHFKGSNFQDYTYTMLQDTLDCLEGFTGIGLALWTLRAVEVGANIKINQTPIDLIHSAPLTLKGKEIKEMDNYYHREVIGRKAILSQYRLKLYDKGLQCNQPQSNLMRVETHFNKMYRPNQLNIFNLSSLKDKTKLANLSKISIAQFKDIIWHEPIKISPTKSKDKSFLLECQNPKYWINKGNPKSKDEIQYHRRKYTALKKKYCHSVQETIAQQLERKYHYLLSH